MSPQELSLEFICPRCGDTISETIEEVPGYDLLADRESDAQGYVEQTVACTGCEHQFTVSIRNTGRGLVAELADHATHVSVIDDPIHEPDDPWEAESSARTCPSILQRSSNSQPTTSVMSQPRWRGRGLGDALNRMLLVQYFSAIEAYLSDRLIRLVLDDPEAMSTLVTGNKEWVADKIRVVELASNPDAFRDWVQDRLRELMYHNFVKIDLYYRSALGW